MARRRRKGNPLLMRILLISIGIHIVVVPILLYFGAFKKIQMSFERPEVVVLPPPEKVKETSVKKVVKKVSRTAPKRGRAKRAEQKGTPLRQHVVAVKSNAGAGGSGNGPTIVNPDKGAAPGTLISPAGPTKTNQPAANENGGSNSSAKAVLPPPPPVKASVAKPIPAPTPPEHHIPVVTDAVATYHPKPTIPDDLRVSDLDTNVVAEIMVSLEGLPEQVKITRSSGSDELDQIALDTAKKWRFKPATRDGQPIEGKVILHIEFEVQK